MERPRAGFWSFTIGHLLTMVTIIITLALNHSKTMERLREVEVKVDILYKLWTPPSSLGIPVSIGEKK